MRFPLTAGLTALGTPTQVILASLAEVVSGSISRSLSMYLGTKSNMDSYRAKERLCDIVIRESAENAGSIAQKCQQKQLQLSQETSIEVAGDLQ